jgi:hypothetical protein
MKFETAFDTTIFFQAGLFLVFVCIVQKVTLVRRGFRHKDHSYFVYSVDE